MNSSYSPEKVFARWCSSVTQYIPPLLTPWNEIILLNLVREISLEKLHQVRNGITRWQIHNCMAVVRIEIHLAEARGQWYRHSSGGRRCRFHLTEMVRRFDPLNLIGNFQANLHQPTQTLPGIPALCRTKHISLSIQPIFIKKKIRHCIYESNFTVTASDNQ
ncbi:MAG: hypothetical protein P8184_19915, partial [Calditrichia bacterium]